jgi:ribosomal protein L35AE/L33A
MKKYGVFLVVLAIILLAMVSFKSNALAAQVIKVNKLNGDIAIDGGENAGFIVGAQVCFPAASGDQLVCGTVLKASASESVVKVDRRYATQIMGGTEALLYKETEEMAEEEEEEIKVEKTEQPKTKQNKDWFQ